MLYGLLFSFAAWRVSTLMAFPDTRSVVENASWMAGTKKVGIFSGKVSGEL
jgi:hypothetical protein